MSTPAASNRREFLKAGAVAASAMSAGIHVHAQDEQTQQKSDLPPVRVALVGCGGRGGGAVRDTMTINDNVRLVAVADLQPEQCSGLVNTAKERWPDRVEVSGDRMFSGLDAYKRILDDDSVDLVMFATPPGFRPYHILDAVKAGKHVFAEKPSCVDPAGYRVCLEAHQMAVKQQTSIVTGTQYRRQVNYVGAVEQIRKGAIGEIVSATTRYCSTGIWYRPRKEDQTDAEYQMQNWMHFVWLSGDQIAEQAVHNIDAINWVMDSAPESAYGSGGRFTRPDDSEMWDSVSVDYVYPGNRVLSFMCRQIPGTQGDNGNVIYGTEGTCYIAAMSGGSKILDRDGKEVWSMKGKISDAYRQEHKDLIDSIVHKNPIVELKQTADSSLTAVMGRMAAYTGKRVTWKFVTQDSKLDLFPQNLTPKSKMANVGPAVPGRTKLT